MLRFQKLVVLKAILSQPRLKFIGARVHGQNSFRHTTAMGRYGVKADNLSVAELTSALINI